MGQRAKRTGLMPDGCNKKAARLHKFAGGTAPQAMSQETSQAFTLTSVFTAWLLTRRGSFAPPALSSCNKAPETA